MIIDIIILLLIILGAFAGYKKGLVGILVSLIGLVLALILGFILQGPVSNYLYNDTGIGSSISDNVSSFITDALDKKSENSESNNDEVSFYAGILKNITNEDQINDAAKNITMYILKGVSFIAIFFTVFIICYILSMILNLVFDLPLLSSVNKLGGIGAGALKALIKIWILLAIISFLSPIPMVDGVVEYIQKTNITNYLYSNNIIVFLISSNLKL